MNTAKDISDKIGRDTIMAAMGVKKRVVQLYEQEGAFPASWYLKLCKLAGESLPYCAFKFQ